MFGDKYLPPAFPHYDSGSSEVEMAWSRAYMLHREAVEATPTPVRDMLESKNPMIRHIGAITAATLEVVQKSNAGSVRS